jgi:hypothetical protein
LGTRIGDTEVFSKLRPGISGEEKKKKQMRAFNSSYFRYVAAPPALEKKVLLLYGERRFGFCLPKIFVDKQARFFAENRIFMKTTTL